MKQISAVLVIALFCGATVADIYMHNPRGSNNRLFTASEQRRNANRLFDSQNNAKGGYNVGEAGSGLATDESQFYKMIHFQSGANTNEPSYLTVEASYQHGCGVDELGCKVVLQYMCQAENDKSETWQIRDGSNELTPNFTIPTKLNETAQEIAARQMADVKSNVAGGQQESWETYNHCYMRKRNSGLFIADQRLNNNNINYASAIFTRQNSKGKRYGFECPEERDYYPYWHPNQWKDIAILTDDTTECDRMRKASFSGKNTLGVCAKADGTRDVAQLIAETAANCTGSGHKWLQVYNYLEKATNLGTEAGCVGKTSARLTYIWGVPHDAKNFNQKECLVAVPTPDCQKAPWSRANHLGIADGTGEFPRYQWVLPYFPSGNNQRCVFRMRYNISNGDYDQATTDYRNNQVNPSEVAWRHRNMLNAQIAEIRKWTNVTRAQMQAEIDRANVASQQAAADEIARGDSPVRQSARVKPFLNGPEVQLAINTDQTGRIFEDRSHAFRLVPRPSQVPAGRKIYNLNVRGKRGNIVQAYNAVEYDFMPNNLGITSSDLIHIQWTGSNHQPGDGEGKANTDRSNMVQIQNYSQNYPLIGGGITMWKSAKVYWTPFQSQSLIVTKDSTATGSVQSDPFSLQEKTNKQMAALQTFVNVNNKDDRAPDALRNDADTQPYDREKDLNDRTFAMRRKRQAQQTTTKAAVTLPPATQIGPGGLTDQQLGLALMTSGYYWCAEKTGCPSYIPEYFIIASNEKANLTARLDEAPASFPGVLVSFNPGTYFYMSTRNNKFSNRSQKGRLVISK